MPSIAGEIDEFGRQDGYRFRSQGVHAFVLDGAGSMAAAVADAVGGAGASAVPIFADCPQERTMNLNCPKCGGEDTRKLTLVMDQGGAAEKGARLGMAYGYNFMLPMFTIVFAIMFGIVFAMMNGYLGLIVFAGILYGGFMLRKMFKNKVRSRYADLPAEMRQNGFQCNRCEHQFIPG